MHLSRAILNKNHTIPLQRLEKFLHDHLLTMLLLAYALAAFFPSLGSVVTHRRALGSGMHFSFSQLLLAFLIFNAGTACQLSELREILKAPRALILGTAFNLAAPLLFITLFAFVGHALWSDQEEVNNILAGIAIVAAMPIAGSSAGWVQIIRGNSSLILGLITLTTLLSPVTTPFFFKLASGLMTGDLSEDLAKIAGDQGTQLFLLLSIILPSLLGILFAHFGAEKFPGVRRTTKFLSGPVLLILNFSNATLAIPQVLRHPDWDFLALILTATFVLCSVGFCGGFFLPRLIGIRDRDRNALTFGLGMNNNGTALVMASTSMADHPLITIPIIFFNLCQQVIAAFFSKLLKEEGGTGVPPA